MLAYMLASANPVSHVLDSPVSGAHPELTAWLTVNSMAMVLATLLLIVVLVLASKAIRTGAASEGNERYITKNPFSHMLEVIVVYLRDSVIRAQLGKELGDKFAPFLLTLFFFVLANNLLGLVPLLDLQHLIGGFTAGNPKFAVLGGTATGRLAVTAGLATVAFIAWQIHGIRNLGIGGWLHHFLGGAPVFLAPIMVPVELIGMIVKPGALAIRLFANMTAGHILLAVLVGFSSLVFKNGILAPVSVISFAAAIAIMFLELFVALLQAYLFTFLTTLFISQLTHHHDDDHGHEDEHDTHAAAA